MKIKINNLILIKFKIFWIAKETINKQKTVHRTGKIFANEVTDKRLISKIQTIHVALYQKKKTHTENSNPIKKWEEALNRHFSREYITDVHVKE